MPGLYTPDPDDYTSPLDADWASIGANEFRTLKEKLTNFFSTSGINTPDNTYYIEHGAYFINDNVANGTDTARGTLSAVSRASGTGAVIGGQVQGSIQSGVEINANLPCLGGYSLFIAAPGSEAGVQGIEGHRIDVIQENGSGQPWAKGLVVRFMDRGEGQADVTTYTDPNYNRNATAVFITSQIPTTIRNEKCGWSRGIRFDDYALMEDGVGAEFIEIACGIDFSGLHAFKGPIMPVPFNFHADQLLENEPLNSGAIDPPTKVAGFVRVTFDNAINLWWGIPIYDLTPG